MQLKGKRASKVCALAVAMLGPGAGVSLGQLRVVSMNSANSDPAASGPRMGMDLILQAMGTSVSDDPTMAGSTGIAKPIDVLALQESAGWATTGAAYADLLNTLVPGANYQVAEMDGATTGAGTQSLVYNANVVSLVGTAVVGTVSTSGQPRQTTRFELRPVGYGADADLYIYNAHMKASSDSTSQGRRETEAVAIRADADALPAGSNVLYVGDFNLYRSTEAAYQTLLSSGNGQAFDPIDRPGTWTNGSSFKNVHTQSPYDSATASALGTGFHGTAGGMDDRFDFQLASANLVDGQGLAYIPNSYQAFGNNGTHQINDPIDDASNTAQPTDVLRAMASTLDHLPVVADYQLPARMAVTVSAAPARVIVGTAASVTASVSNAAPVQFASGADVLQYAMTTGGALSGSAAGTREALAGAADHAVTLGTGTVGSKSGTVSVVSANQQVADGSFAQTIEYAVVDHSNGSLSSGAAAVTSQAIDFGYVPVGFGPRTAGFAIANLPAASGWTADLALPSVTVTGSPGLTTDVVPFAHLAAGAENSYTAALDASAAGELSATQTFNVSDEAIPGATAGVPLALTMTARVIGSATFPATGFIQLNSGQTYDAGALAIGAGVTLTKTGPGAMNVTGGQSNGAGSALVVSGGAVTMGTDAGSAGNGVLAVSTENAGSAVTFAASQHLAGLSVGDGTVVTVTAGGGKVLVAGPVSVAGTGRLDLNDNDAVMGASAEVVRGYLLSGRAGGSWDGAGIMSTAAAADDSRHATGIGYAPESIIGTTFDGEAVDPASVVLKYTWYGDANLDGVVNADDYALVDRGMAAGLGGWVDGDFDYDGRVSEADYLLMDTAYGVQAGGVLSAGMLAEREARFGGAYVSELVAAVPEPGSLLGLAGVLLLVGGRRSCSARGGESGAALRCAALCPGVGG